MAESFFVASTVADKAPFVSYRQMLKLLYQGVAMPGWKPVVTLPNIELEEPIEGGLVALVPAHDSRVKSLVKAHINFRKYLGRFTDAFGRKFKPSVLIVPENVPDIILRADALASFRDAIASSVVPYNRAIELKYPRGHRVFWANTFSIFPWMIDKHYEALIGNTPAILGMDDVADFRGQSSPELFRMTLSSRDIDEPLLAVLIERWRTRYAGGEPAWSERALFRSLNMAFVASQLPAGTEITFYDVGRSTALWVSAFEILAHPRDSDSGLRQVHDLLESAPWDLDASKAPICEAFAGRNRPRRSRNTACWLYGELCHARNDFLHGNPVEMDRLIIDKTGRNLFDFAAPLYRMALAAFLSLAWSKPLPSVDDAAEFVRYISDRMDFMSYQRAIEEGLLKAHEPHKR
jgi:hypothetical protein